MAKPRVFISSTYYDLKYVRSSLELFVESLGFDAILSEKGSIAYSPDMPLDESCYREAQSADIFVLIVGGRYGSEASGSNVSTPKSFFERYESITKKEYSAALAKDLPIYILVERSVYAEYGTFERNRDNTTIQYAHVDSVNVFRFLAEILSQPRNNPVQTFDKYSEIEEWLRSQWAGLFRELLQRRSNQAQLASLTAQVAELGEVNKTLKRYMEEVVTKVAPEHSAKLIRSESRRLRDARMDTELRRNGVVEFMTALNVPFALIKRLIRQSESAADFIVNTEASTECADKVKKEVRSALTTYQAARQDLSDARLIMGLAGLPDVERFAVPTIDMVPIPEPPSE